MTESRDRIFGLDDQIIVDGRQTTIRAEHAAERVRSERDYVGAVSASNPSVHWALISGKAYGISAQDFALLRGEPFPHPAAKSS